MLMALGPHWSMGYRPGHGVDGGGARPASGQSAWPNYPNNSAISVTSGGNVGIGTSTPGAPLHLLAVGATPQLIVNGGSVPGAPTGITFRIDATDM
jgi:hypothetical protein